MQPETDNLLDRTLPIQIRSAALVTTLLLAVMYTAYFAATIVIPITAGLLLYFLFSPVVSVLVRWGSPRGLAALTVILVLVSGAVSALYALSDPAAGWLQEAPTSLNELRSKFRRQPNPLAEVRKVSEAVEDTVQEITGGETARQSASSSVQIREPGLLDSVMGRLPTAIGSFIVTMVLTLFLLISGDSLLRKVTAMGATFAVRRRTVTIIRHIEREIARYLGTVAMINVALGVVVAGAMHALDVPSPILWGTVAGILNFAPYAGAAVTTGLLLLVGISAFETMDAMLAPSLVFLVITVLEGQVVTPLLLGRRLELSPVVVLLSVLVFGWMWGLIGALMAVPIVASIRILLVHVPRLKAVGTLLAK